MIRLNSFLAALALIALVACNTKKKTTDGFLIAGKLDNTPADSEVFLDEVAFTEAKPIDTAKVDKDGAYELTGKVTEEGLYRLRYAGDKYLLLVIDPETRDMEVNADTASIFKKTYTVTGSPKSEQMRKLLNEINTRSESMQRHMAGASDTSASDADMQKSFDAYQGEATAARQYVINYADTVSSPVLAIFAASNFLNPQTDLMEINALSKKLVTKYPNNALVMSFNSSLTPQAQAQPNQQQQDPYAPKQMFANGQPVPDINGQTPDGKLIALSSLRGQYVLVDFWASWCKPCRMENPVVVDVYNKYKSKGFTIYSVSLDDKKDKWVEAIAQDKLAWNHHVSDLKGWQSALSGQYGVTSIPTNYLIDKEGKVLAFNLRGAQLEQALAQFIQ